MKLFPFYIFHVTLMIVFLFAPAYIYRDYMFEKSVEYQKQIRLDHIPWYISMFDILGDARYVIYFLVLVSPLLDESRIFYYWVTISV